MKGRAFLFAALFAIAGLSVGNYLLASKTPHPKLIAKSKTEARVIELPEDGQHYYTSVFLPSGWQSNATVRVIPAWFATHPQLASLKAQTHFNVFETGSVMFKTRYAASVKTVPCVVVQNAKGKVVFKQTSPASADQLATDIADSLCPLNRRPKPDPKPEPEPDTTPDIDEDPVPDIVPDTQPEPKSALPLWLAIALGVGGAAVGAASKLYENKEK